jgi:ParB family transcriptional regulator, chromosome partitioning protein
MPKLETKPLGFFKPDPTQPRKHFDEEGLRHLGESLKVRQNEPLQAMPDGMILDGERRWRAAGLVKLEKLDVIITDLMLTAEMIAVIRLTTFFHRADLKPSEKSAACIELLAKNPDWDQQRVAKELKVSAGTITHLVSPGKCIPEVGEALKADKITIADCYKISQNPDPEVQRGLLNMRLSGLITNRDGLGREAKKRGSSTSTARANRIKIELGKASVTISGADLSLDDAIDAVKDAQREMTKGRDLGLDAKTIVSVARDKAKAGA